MEPNWKTYLKNSIKLINLLNYLNLLAFFFALLPSVRSRDEEDA